MAARAEVAIDSPPPDLAPGMLANLNIRIYDSLRMRSIPKLPDPPAELSRDSAAG